MTTAKARESYEFIRVISGVATRYVYQASVTRMIWLRVNKSKRLEECRWDKPWCEQTTNWRYLCTW